MAPLRTLLALTLAALAVLAAPLRAEEPPALATEAVVSGLALPIFATAAPGEPDRIYVLEQLSSRIRLVVGDTLQAEPFLDLSELVNAGGERGLLGLAFHPDYQRNGAFFVAYNDLDKDMVLARYQVDPSDPDKALAASAQILLTVDKPFDQHNGGTLAFSPLDGTLWMSLGDGGDGNDPFNNAQDLSTLLGSILRLDVDGAAPYAIPADNPFVDRPNARDEIYAYGLRNPWRFSFDRQTGWAFIGDVGQGEREEVDVIRAGKAGLNFGWRCMEGSLCTDLGDCPCPLPKAEPPVFEYDHNDGCAIIGGYVYRGADIPALDGFYLFGDYCTSKVWALDMDAPGPLEAVDVTAQLNPPGSTLGFVSSFGEDGRGEVLIVSYSGTIYRIVEAADDADCDGDGLTDAEELAAGSEFDVNDNGLPDSCELALTASDLVLGQPAQLDFVGAQPGQPIVWFASLRGIGEGPCYFGGTVCLDLKPMVLVPGQEPDVLLLAITQADGQGAASLSFTVPAAGLGTPLAAFQALVFDGPASLLSNPVQKLFEEP